MRRNILESKYILRNAWPVLYYKVPTSFKTRKDEKLSQATGAQGNIITKCDVFQMTVWNRNGTLVKN
jgi:hypothetical protein